MKYMLSIFFPVVLFIAILACPITESLAEDNLLNKGSKIGITNSQGLTPLMLAIGNGSIYGSYPSGAFHRLS